MRKAKNISYDECTIFNQHFRAGVQGIPQGCAERNLKRQAERNEKTVPRHSYSTASSRFSETENRHAVRKNFPQTYSSFQKGK